MDIENTIEYKFTYKGKENGLLGDVIISVRSFRKDYDHRDSYRVRIQTKGELFNARPMIMVDYRRPYEMNYISDYRATSLIKMLRAHCHLVSITPPEVIDLNQTFHYIQPENYVNYIQWFTNTDGEDITRDNFIIPPTKFISKIRQKSLLHPSATISFV